MNNYKIKNNIKIEECNEEVDNQLLEKKDGSSNHFTDISKKNFEKKGDKEHLRVNLHPYQVDGKVARFTFNTHSLIQGKLITVLLKSYFHHFMKINGMKLLVLKRLPCSMAL